MSNIIERSAEAERLSEPSRKARLLEVDQELNLSSMDYLGLMPIETILGRYGNREVIEMKRSSFDGTLTITLRKEEKRHAVR